MNDFDADVTLCNHLYNQMLDKSWGFVPMTAEEFRHHAKQMRQFADPDWILIAEVDGKPAGFCLTIPDVNEAIRPLNGRLTTWGVPIGLVRLIRNLRRIRTGRVVALGVLPEFRQRGITELCILRTIEIGASKLKITKAELGWTLEDNDKINGPIQKVGGSRYKTFRILNRAI